MFARAVGEDELAARKLLDRLAEAVIQLDGSMIDVMREIEEVVRIDIVFLDQRPQGRAVFVIEIFLQGPCRPSMPKRSATYSVIRSSTCGHMREVCGYSVLSRSKTHVSTCEKTRESEEDRWGSMAGFMFMDLKDDNGAVRPHC
jgi:hypothetical protein